MSYIINKIEKRVPERYPFFRLLEEAAYQMAVDPEIWILYQLNKLAELFSSIELATTINFIPILNVCLFERIVDGLFT
ncbi:hypothetical protein [Peribacillus butanolivorans]|uniref:hypothetical protein n=1 Tax=Peribacillus butanolivorans TaxID=421767 RepID=UPI00207D2A72|nr:hypothetical protein [Peribacillus butanolivorans]